MPDSCITAFTLSVKTSVPAPLNIFLNNPVTKPSVYCFVIFSVVFPAAFKSPRPLSHLPPRYSVPHSDPPASKELKSISEVVSSGLFFKSS